MLAEQPAREPAGNVGGADAVGDVEDGEAGYVVAEGVAGDDVAGDEWEEVGESAVETADGEVDFVRAYEGYEAEGVDVEGRLVEKPGCRSHYGALSADRGVWTSARNGSR